MKAKLNIKNAHSHKIMTSLSSGQGHYLFIETSSPRRVNDTAQLLSPLVSPRANAQCIRFWYHMYGPDVNTLNVYTMINNRLGAVAWTHTGTIDNQWHFQAVDLTTTGGTSFRVGMHTSLVILQ